MRLSALTPCCGKNTEFKVQKSHLVSSNGPRELREGKEKFRTVNVKLRTYMKKRKCVYDDCWAHMTEKHA